MEATHVVAVDQVDGTLLAHLHEQVLMGSTLSLVGQQKHSAGAYVRVLVEEVKLIVRSEPVSQGEAGADGRTEFGHGVAEVVSGPAIKSPVARSKKNVEG